MTVVAIKCNGSLGFVHDKSFEKQTLPHFLLLLYFVVADKEKKSRQSGTSAYIKGPEIKEDAVHYEFVTTIGTKG